MRVVHKELTVPGSRDISFSVNGYADDLYYNEFGN